LAYAKAVFAGIAVALVACVLWIVGVFVLPLMVPIVVQRLSDTGSGGTGAAFASFSTGPLMLVCLIGFAAGFTWQLRRARR
jgi:hypothetical protein